MLLRLVLNPPEYGARLKKHAHITTISDGTSRESCFIQVEILRLYQENPLALYDQGTLELRDVRDCRCASLHERRGVKKKSVPARAHGKHARVRRSPNSTDLRQAPQKYSLSAQADLRRL